MNRKHEEENLTPETGEYAVHRSHRGDIIAAIICLLLAVIVWMMVMNAEDTAFVELTVKGGEGGYTYVLSDEALEVAGTVISLKKAKKETIEIIVPEEATAPGTYHISLEDLVLPEGVSLTELPDLTLTVEAK